MRDLVLIDLDGTLVDSLVGIHAACVEMAMTLEIAPPTVEFVRRSIGRGADVLVEKVLMNGGEATRTTSDHVSARDLFDRAYREGWRGGTALRPGAFEVVEDLVSDGREAIVATNKPRGPAEAMVRHFGLDRIVSRVVTPDHAGIRKPDPQFVDVALSNRCRSRAILIGDSMVDAETAFACNIPFIALAGGYNAGERIQDSNIRDSVVAQSWADIRAAVSRLDHG